MSLLPRLSLQYAELYDFSCEVIRATLENIDLDLPEDSDREDVLDGMVKQLAKKLLDNRPRIKKAKKEKDENEPKRPKSAYLLFCEDKRPELKKQLPNFKPKEIMIRLGEAWKKLSEEEKKPYNLAYKHSKAKYEADKKEYLLSLASEEDDTIDE